MGSRQVLGLYIGFTKIGNPSGDKCMKMNMHFFVSLSLWEEGWGTTMDGGFDAVWVYYVYDFQYKKKLLT